MKKTIERQIEMNQTQKVVITLISVLAAMIAGCRTSSSHTTNSTRRYPAPAKTQQQGYQFSEKEKGMIKEAFCDAFRKIGEIDPNEAIKNQARRFQQDTK